MDETGDAVSPDAAQLVLGGTMKALSVRWPYAGLLMWGLKQFETRDWPTKYRGKLAIHCSKVYDHVDRRMADELAREWPEIRARLQATRAIPLGCVLGIVELKEIYRTHEIAPRLTALERAVGNYQPGRAAWHVKVLDVFPQPVPAVGKLGLWDWTAA